MNGDQLYFGLLFRHIAIEGPPGVGKTVLAERLSARLDATVVLDERENPFLHEFYQGRTGAAFQAQLFFTLARYRQQGSLRQSDLFSQLLIANYLFDRDKIYAYVNLDDNELFIYQRLYDLIAPDVPPPDLVIYLQTPVEVVRRRLRERAKADPSTPLPAAGLHPRAERGLQPFLLPLHGEPAAHGRDVPRRSDMERRDRRRHRAADTIDGEGHAILRSQDAITGCHRCLLQIPTPPGVPRRTPRVLARVLSFAALVAPFGCASAPPAPPKPLAVAHEQKMAWMLQLEDQRILKLPEPPPPPVVAPVKGQRPAPLPPPPASVPDLTKLATDADPRVRRRAAIAMGRVGLQDAVPALTTLLADTDTDVRQSAAVRARPDRRSQRLDGAPAAAPGSRSAGARPRRRSARPDGRRGRGAGDRARWPRSTPHRRRSPR